MKTVATTDAKAHLNALLGEVEAGESFLITNHGRRVAVLAPVEQPRRRFGGLAGVVTPADDFDAPLSVDELDAWGESDTRPSP